LSQQNISIFASVSHADLEGHLPKMSQLEWKVLAPKSKEEDQPVSIVALTFCNCGCETMAIADSDGQVCNFILIFRH
jgi:hypothetical protein